MNRSIPFIGRKRELARLESAFAASTFQFLPVYGRRRVGKTSLLKEFTSTKSNVFFFTARQTTAADNLAYLSDEIHKQLSSDSPTASDDAELFAPSIAPIYPSFADALEAIFQRAIARSDYFGKPIIVLDEYPYLAESEPSVSSILQIIIDRIKNDAEVLLILCGSSMSFMEHQVLGEKSPLYGRRTGQIKLEPMDAFESASVLDAIAGPRENSVDAKFAAEAYGIAGGIPLYLEQFDPALSIEDNLAKSVFVQDAFLYGEPSNYLLQEVRTPASYNAILAAVASGHTQLTAIANAAGINANTAGAYLRRLSDLQVLKRRDPVPKRNGGRSGYYITDPLFGFWFAVTTHYTDAIEAGLGARVAQHVVDQAMPTYLGHVFEDVCRQWLTREIADKAIDVFPRAIGRWWGTDPRAREQADIDVTVDTYDGPLILCECKWQQAPMDVEVLRTLERRAEQFGERETWLYGFSRTGFTQGAQDYAATKHHVSLITLDDLFKP